MARWIFALLAGLVVLPGAHAVTVSGFSGRLHNFTQLPTQAFEFRYIVSCAPGCGDFEFTAKVEPDGGYSIPDFQIGAGTSYSMYATMSIPDKDPQYPYGAIPGEIIHSVEKRNLADTSALAVKDFTLLSLEPARLQLVLRSGADVGQWLLQEGRDEGVTIELAFSAPRDLETSFHLEQSGFRLKDWTTVSAHHILVAGNYASNAPVTVSVTAGDHTEQHQMGFTNDLNSMLGTIEFGDLPSDVVPGERRLDFDYTDTYVFLDYDKRDQVDFPEIGFSYATLRVACTQGGRISGEILYRDGQFPTDPPTTRDAVSGTCSGEQGEIELPLHLKSGVTVNVKAPYHRVRALSLDRGGRKSLDKTLFSEAVGHDEMDVFQGNELTLWLPLISSDGTYFGYMEVSTSRF